MVAVKPRTELPLLEVPTARHWRRWLEKHHKASRGVWLLFHKRHTGAASISSAEANREVLCFGWIDSLVKRLDADRYAIKMTPRKPTSKWSAINRKRWAELKVAGRLAPAGLAAAPTANTYAPLPKIPVLPSYIAKAFKANAAAWTFFGSLPPRERRNFVVWIHMAKRPETREQRILESIELLSAGKRLGLK